MIITIIFSSITVTHKMVNGIFYLTYFLGGTATPVLLEAPHTHYFVHSLCLQDD